MTDTEIRYTTTATADFLDLLAEGVTIPKAAKANGIHPDHASLLARAHGWPDCEVMSRTADKLREPAKPAPVNSVAAKPQKAPAAPRPTVKTKPLQSLAAELDELLQHPDWRVAAAARLILSDVRTLRTHYRHWEASQKETAA